MLLLSRSLHGLLIGRPAAVRPHARCTMSTLQQGPPLLAEAQAFFAERGLQLRCDYHAPPGSRTTSRVAVRSSASGEAVIGMFRPGTHEVVPCGADARCHEPHHPAINAAIEAVLRALRDDDELTAYDEASRRGTLRYLQLSVERSSQRVQLVLSFIVACT